MSIVLQAPSGFGNSEWIVIVIIITILYFYIKGKNKSNNDNNLKEKNTPTVDSNKINIPDTCPHCKNPNTKKIRLCEWCGNKII